MNRILILGGDSDFNLGDAAILSSLCHCAANAATGVEITITSKFRRCSSLPGVVRVLSRSPARFGELLCAARHSDLVLVGGGGLFQDDDSRIKMPFWTGLITALRSVNKNIAGLSLGVGPLRHAESRQLARATCAMFRSVSVRDPFASAWLKRCTSREIHVVPDPAFMLPAAAPSDALAAIQQAGISGRPVIGVALRRWFHSLGGFVPHRVRASLRWDSTHGEQELETCLDALAICLRRLSHALNAAILFLPTYNVAHENDAAVCRRLAAKLGGVSVGSLEISDPHLYKAVVGQLSLLISARMHPLILASSMGTPIVGLAYNGKFDGLYELLTLEQKPLWLDDSRNEDFTEQLEAQALRALECGPMLKARTSQLAARVCDEANSLIAWAE